VVSLTGLETEKTMTFVDMLFLWLIVGGFALFGVVLMTAWLTVTVFGDKPNMRSPAAKSNNP